MRALAPALLLLSTALAALVPRAVAPWPLDLEQLVVCWVVAMTVALVASGRVLQPPRDVRLGPVSPVAGGVLTAALTLYNPGGMGACLAIVPLALASHLSWSHALRQALREVPFELWEAAWLLGASRTQAVRHVALPAARGLRPRLGRSSAEVAVGLLVALLALGWTA